MRGWLKELRQSKNFSQAHMAELLGISRQYYNFIENGKKLPDLTFSIVVQLSEIFGISLEKIKKFEKEYHRQGA